VNLPKRREIACAILIDVEGRFLLQRRDDNPGIAYPGRIGLFGGHREGDESFSECVAREVREETGLSVSLDRLEFLGSFQNDEVIGEFFVIRGVFADALRVTEGLLCIVEQHDLPALEPQLAPSVTTAFEMLFKAQDL
jgi:8-oxo-dGTP pyrophosphatase MutT (NUDIX family)